MNLSQIVGSAIGFIIVSIPIVAALLNLAARIQSIHLALNSRLTELLEISKASSHAKGLAEGRQESRPELLELSNAASHAEGLAEGRQESRPHSEGS